MRIQMQIEIRMYVIYYTYIDYNIVGTNGEYISCNSSHKTGNGIIIWGVCLCVYVYAKRTKDTDNHSAQLIY